MKHYYVVLGMPGAGKDTQCDVLAKKLHASIIKTGNLARAAAKTDPEVAAILQKGGLIDDKKMNALLIAELEKTADEATVVFDGFPRRLEQAKWLDNYMGAEAASSLHVYYLEISRNTAIKRLSKRQRADDTKEVIDRRLDVFKQETDPVVHYYQAGQRLVVIDGEPSRAVVQDNLWQRIEPTL